MTKEVLYVYLGTNGTITSKVHLEDIYYVRKYRLIADENKLLTDGKKEVYSVTVSEDEMNDWYEINNPRWD